MLKTRILTALPRALIDAGYATPKYRDLYAAAVNGRFPAKQEENGRWSFCLDEVDTIAQCLALPHDQSPAFGGKNS